MIKKRNPKARHYVVNETFYYALIEYFEKCDVVKDAWDKLHGVDKELLIASGVKPKKIFDHLPKIEWPRVTEYLGKTMLDIATNSNNMPNFCGYSYKDDMIGDGYEDCILRIRSFNVSQARIRVYSKTPGAKDRLLLTTGNRDEFKRKLIEFGYKLDVETFEADILHKFKHELEYDDFRVKIDRNPFAYFTTACYYASVRRIKKEKRQKTTKSEMIKNSGIIDSMITTAQPADASAHYENSYLSFLQDSVDEEQKHNSTGEKKNLLKRTTKAHQQKLKMMEELAAANEADLNRTDVGLDSNSETSEDIDFYNNSIQDDTFTDTTILLQEEE